MYDFTFALILTMLLSVLKLAAVISLQCHVTVKILPIPPAGEFTPS